MTRVLNRLASVELLNSLIDRCKVGFTRGIVASIGSLDQHSQHCPKRENMPFEAMVIHPAILAPFSTESRV